jgi:hypothetical protein
MSYLKRGACALLAIVATASMQLASADVINSQHPFLTTNGNTHTTIVRGGEVAHMSSYDTSIVNVSGGHVSHLTMNDSAWVRLLFGDISHLTLNGSAATTLADGAIGHLTLNGSAAATLAGGTVSHVTLNASARGTVANGEISFLRVFDNSTAVILGAPTLSWLVVSQTSHVDIYVTDAVFSSGRLSGTWLDGAPFEFGVMVGSSEAPWTTPAQLPSNITIHAAASVPTAD